MIFATALSIFEDAHRLGILSFEEVKKAFMALLEKNPQENLPRVQQNLESLSFDQNEAVAYLRAKCINFLVQQCAEVFMDNAETILAGEFKSALIDSIVGLQEVLAHIQNVSIKRIYNHDSVVKIELAGFRIMSGLIEDLVEAALLKKGQRKKRHKKLLDLMPYQNQFEESDTDYQKVMCVLDYVSAMTDNFALNLYRNLRGISVPSI